MTAEWLASKTTEELTHWVSYYQEELKTIQSELHRRKQNESV